MKKSFLSKVLAVLVAFSMTVPAFAAEYVAAITTGSQTIDMDNLEESLQSIETKYTLKDFENEAYNDALEEGSGNTLHILDSFEMSATVYVSGVNTTVDLHGNTLTVGGATEDGALAFDCPDGSTVQNGTVVLAAPGEEWAEEMPDGPDGVIKGGADDLHIKNVDIKIGENVKVKAALSTGYGEITVEDSVIDVGNAPALGKNLNGTQVTGNIISGVFRGPLVGTSDEKLTVNKPDTPYATDGNTTVYTSDKTAAVVKDADGKYHLYDDLAEASKVVGEGVTVEVVDKALKAPDGFEIKDGVLSKVEKVEEPINPNPVTPVTPVTPVFPEVIDVAAGGSSTEIADEEIPLAGLITRGELVSYLYVHEGSPDGEDAEGEYVKAMAWAVAQEIVAEDDDPEEVVTGAILRDVMTAYAELLGTTFDVEVEDDAPVMNCDELLTAFFEAQEARTK